jgi:outer membrane lipopolysaccharide assembly protein LptE/RlpB|tara:strand:- start:355 stop:813 length:459 start_codon:yes stop_codon:yes gene_type:complete
MKNIAIITLVLFLSHCGYSSIYKNQQSIDFQINIIETEGDYEMNNLIKNEIKLYSNKESVKIYKIKIDTDYKKDVLTKNSSGVITDYNLSVISVFSINLENKNKTFKFEENINIKNQTDTFEQNTYEKDIKRNFASTIREKLFSAILSINDN